MPAYFRSERFASCWAYLLFLSPCSQEAAFALLLFAILISYTSNLALSSRVRTKSSLIQPQEEILSPIYQHQLIRALITLLLTPGFSTVFFNHIKGHFKQLLIMVSHLEKTEETGNL